MRQLLILVVLAGAVRADEPWDVVDKHAAPLLKDLPFAAVVVGVVADGKEQVFGFGTSEGKAPDRDTMFEIGSATKAFTGILLADRVKAGVVKLDDPVKKHLPDEWTVPQRDGRDITLLHLATHTSGLPKQADGFLVHAIANLANPYSKYDLAALRKGLATTKLENVIGARYGYSNVGVGLLGHVLAFASKAPSYEALLADRVLKPLGMGDSGITLSDGQKKRLIAGHDEKGKMQHQWDFASIEAAGGLRSTVGDMLKFVQANATPVEQIRDALAISHQCWRVIRPDVDESGLCWIRYPTRKGLPAIVHNGQTGGYHSFVGFVPGKGGVVVLCNVATMRVDEIGLAVLKYLRERK